jgi:hypothetical protein
MAVVKELDQLLGKGVQAPEFAVDNSNTSLFVHGYVSIKLCSCCVCRGDVLVVNCVQLQCKAGILL